jgi:flagellar assembly protein FliH
MKLDPVRPVLNPVAPSWCEAADRHSIVQTAEHELEAIKRQILRDAESLAEERIREAMQQAETLRREAETEIAAWWQQRREEDERHIAECRDLGFKDGYQEGARQAEADVRTEYNRLLEEARTLLEQAYRMKEQIIQEAEPFLLELSCAIAAKIVNRQLSIEPDWLIEMIRSLLSRRKTAGAIIVCVAPAQFQYVMSARDELRQSIDAESELQIVPDASVGDGGCVIRTSLGSIDARIDTQLAEIKKELLAAARSLVGAESA